MVQKRAAFRMQSLEGLRRRGAAQPTVFVSHFAAGRFRVYG